jgi:hypothetical protein
VSGSPSLNRKVVQGGDGVSGGGVSSRREKERRAWSAKARVVIEK